jgi:hypothetical protein
MIYKHISRTFFLFILLSAAMLACKSKPVVIEAQGGEDNMQELLQNTHSEAHTVKVKEVLQASKYTYAKVEEGGEQFWIAIPSSEIEEGGTYQFVGGLKKTNFYSRDFERTFPTILLVSGLVNAESGKRTDQMEQVMADVGQRVNQATTPASEIAPSEGGISLKELYQNRDKYAGKKVTVTGKCVKVNNEIMGRNWVHLQDGTMDGENPYDLTVTTDALIMVGITVTMEGVIALDKDFGAGYRYDIIMENASRK